MYCWGSTVHGELGLGGIEEEQIMCPRSLRWNLASTVQFVACGDSHSLLATNEGQIYSCGNNDHGQLGHEQPRKRPQLVTGLDSCVITQVACGESHSLALNQWGHVYSWGSDSHGQLGHKLDGENQPVPKIIRALATTHVVQISCGKRHCLVLTNIGELYVWGANNHGQLGIGKYSQSESTPTQIKSLAGIPIAFIVCGGDHSFAVSASGAVFAWGKNTFGQLGLNNDASQVYPCNLKTLKNVKVSYISCGEDYSVFLTKDGGVFTCGSGSYGQLGHGSTSNEILPRKVTELMGSTITQVTCGRSHTLAFVPSRGRVYGFGLGGSGQLGGRQPRNSTTPQIVLGPWVSPSGTPVVATSEESCVIKRIFAGGDHCFVTVSPEIENQTSYDCRIPNEDFQILKLTEEQLKSCIDIPCDSTADSDLWAYLEHVFKSLACINASFLLPNGEHYCCTSKHHGLNLEAAEKGFSWIGKIENDSVRELILRCVTEDLLKQLTTSPPDVETLRVYITLPLYHEFCNPKHHEILHKPFALALQKLTQTAKRIIESWWNMMSVEYFERLIEMYKSVVSFILQLQKIPEDKTVCWDSSLVISLDMLAQLNQLNHNVEGLKVPYDTFHLPNLNQYLDVRIDYVSWLSDPSSDKLFLCNYPFLFDAEAKTLLLQTDQAIQMQTAMSEAATRAFLSLFTSMGSGISQYLVLHVSRDNLVLDALRELTEVNTSDLRKPLKVKFVGEEADDAGGVRKEFFMLLLREIFDPKYGMFKEDEETRMMWFSEHSFEDEVMYLLIGILCGLAIYNFTIIDLPFPLALYKKILEEPVTLADLREFSPTLANSLQELLNYTEPDLEQVFSLNFEITKDVYGEVKVIPLKPGGENIPVTLENRQEYVTLYVDYIFNKSVEKHYKAFSKGFLKVCGGRVLKLFHSHELRAVIVGNQNYDWHVLESGADYKQGYSSSDQTIQWFWEVFHELTEEDKKKFLLFLTGSDRIPITGMKSITITIQPTTDEKFLPVAHTCFNLLDLPRYQTKERLRYKLLQAIQQTEGFSLV